MVVFIADNVASGVNALTGLAEFVGVVVFGDTALAVGVFCEVSGRVIFKIAVFAFRGGDTLHLAAGDVGIAGSGVLLGGFEGLFCGLRGDGGNPAPGIVLVV